MCLVVGALGKLTWSATVEPCDDEGVLGKTDFLLRAVSSWGQGVTGSKHKPW